MVREAESVAEAIKALGGTKAVADLLGRKPQAVSNWRNTGFPANTYLVLKDALEKINWTAPPSLWGMAEVKSNLPPTGTSGKAA